MKAKRSAQKPRSSDGGAFKKTELKDKTLIQKLEMINGLSEYNRSVVGIRLDSIIEKDKLEKSQENKMKRRLEELEKVRKK